MATGLCGLDCGGSNFQQWQGGPGSLVPSGKSLYLPGPQLSMPVRNDVSQPDPEGSSERHDKGQDAVQSVLHLVFGLCQPHLGEPLLPAQLPLCLPSGLQGCSSKPRDCRFSTSLGTTWLGSDDSSLQGPTFPGGGSTPPSLSSSWYCRCGGT